MELKFTKKYKRKKVMKEYFQFEYSKEILIYNFLYLRHLKKKDLKKLKKYDICKGCYGFERHYDWEQYINNKYKCYSKESLLEFLYFLRYQKNYSAVFDNVIALFLLPLAATVVGNLTTDYINDIINIKNILLIIPSYFFYLSFLLWLLIGIKNQLSQDKQDENMYTEYIEIINKMIKDKT